MLTFCSYPQAGHLTTKFNKMNENSNNHKTVNEAHNPRLRVGDVSRSYFDLEEMATHDGHITISANDYLCGGKWQYYGILSKAERIRFPRAKNNYLKYIPLNLVECDICKELKYQELMAKRSS